MTHYFCNAIENIIYVYARELNYIDVLEELKDDMIDLNRILENK